MKITKNTYLALFAVLLSPMAANAVPITSESDLDGVETLIDFSQFSNIDGVSGPVQIGGLVGEDVSAMTVDGAADMWLYNGGWGLSANGTWNSDRSGYLGIYPGDGPVRIDFNDGGISGFGFFMNICPMCSDLVTLSAYDADGILLELFDITATANISTPDGINAGAFRGIQLSSNDISYIEIFGNTAVFDDLRFVRSESVSVPEPGTLALLGIGLFGMGLARRRKNLIN